MDLNWQSDSLSQFLVLDLLNFIERYRIGDNSMYSVFILLRGPPATQIISFLLLPRLHGICKAARTKGMMQVNHLDTQKLQPWFPT